MMRFVVDAQLPPALARWLTAAGYVGDHVLDLGLERASDLEIWRFAEQSGAVIISKDEDFVQLGIFMKSGPQVVWIRLRNTRTAQLIVWFEKVFPLVLAALERGDRLVEVS